MIIYLLSFAISYLFFSIAYCSKNKFFHVLFYSLAILEPSLVAGFRDTSVGIDLEVYAVPAFDSLVDVKSFNDFVLSLALYQLEPFWAAFNFLVTRFSSNFFWSLFLQQIMVLTLVTITCYKLRERLYPPHLYLVYLLFFFCFSMSANRQIFAIAIIFYSIPYVYERKLFKFLICVLIATLFHSSGVLSLFLYPLYNYYNNGGKRVSVFKIGAIVIFGGLLVLFFPIIIKTLLSYGLMTERFEKYADAEFNTHKADLAFFAVLYFFSFLKIKNIVLANGVKILTLLIIFMTLCGQYNDVAQRVAMYYDILLFITILQIAKTKRNNFITYILLSMIFVCFVVYATIANDGIAHAIPYTSKALGISL